MYKRFLLVTALTLSLFLLVGCGKEPPIDDTADATLPYETEQEDTTGSEPSLYEAGMLHFTSDIDNFLPPEANAKLRSLQIGYKHVIEYSSDDTLPCVYFAYLLDGETFALLKTVFEDPGVEYTSATLDDLQQAGENGARAVVKLINRDSITYVTYSLDTQISSTSYEPNEPQKYETPIWQIANEPPVIDTLPDILTEEVPYLPHGIEASLMEAWFPHCNGTYFFFESGKEKMEFYLRVYAEREVVYYKHTLTLPDGYSNGRIIKGSTTSGGIESDGIQFIVEAKKEGELVFLNYTLLADTTVGLYVLSPVSETTEEEFTPTLGERPLEFVTHSLYTQVGVTVSLSIPKYWRISYSGGGNAYFDEEDVLNILPLSTSIKRILVQAVDKDFDTLLSELQSDKYPVSDAIMSGTTIGGHQYKGVSVDMHSAIRHIFLITTERESYIFEVWEWSDYDADFDFIPDVVIPVVESFSVEYDEEGSITDLADWENLPWVEPPREDGKRCQDAYNFIYDMVSGESKYPEINGLGIEDYKITLLENGSAVSVFRFTFTVTGNSLPETLPPGTYTKIIYPTLYVNICDDKKPETSEEYAALYYANQGLDKFGEYSAVKAVHAYLSVMWWEISPYGEWDITNGFLPSGYICTYYDDNNSFEVSFDDFARLLYEKFGISYEKPTEDCLIYRCTYDSATDTVRYTDTRAYTHTHRFVNVTEEDGITYVTVQLYADDLYLLPSHKIVYKIGEGDVFLGCEIVNEGNYPPYSIHW